MTTMFMKRNEWKTLKGLLFSLIGFFWQLHDFEQAGVKSAKF